jgi:membrane protein YdbS with pleckstrin-like domain
VRRIGSASMHRRFPYRFHQARALQSSPAPDDLPSPVDDAGAAASSVAPNGLPGGWQQLPARGAKMAAGGAFLGTLCALLVVSVVARLTWHVALPWGWIALASLVLALLGAVIAYRRHRYTRWRLDAQGFALMQGRLWQSETHIPISRVQHLDVRRGPLERAARLSTLVVHTAGTRLSAVSVSGLDRRDAEHLRDRLAHQLDHDDDAL